VNKKCEGHETVRKEAGDSDLQEGEVETEPGSGPIKTTNNSVILFLSISLPLLLM
jgi:hypothetical protein